MSSSRKAGSTPGIFVCDSNEEGLTACVGEPFYSKHDGKRYCVLHYPDERKTSDFYKTLEKRLKAKNFNFRGVWFPNLLIINGFDFTEEADFSGAFFNAAIMLTPAVFSAGANFSSAHFKAEASFSGAQFKAEANFSGAQFNAEASFSGSQFKADANFSGAQFQADANFSGAQFKAEADYSGAQFNAEACFSGSQFTGKTNFSNALFGGGGNFVSAEFIGSTEFHKARFKTLASFKNAHVNDISFMFAIFENDVGFMDTKFADAANFTECSFRKNAVFEFAKFGKAAHFPGAKFEGDAVFGAVTFNGKVDFLFATFHGEVGFESASFMDYVQFRGQLNEQVFKAGASLRLQECKVKDPDHFTFSTVALRPHWFVGTDSRRFALHDITWGWDKIRAKKELDALHYEILRSPHRQLAIACSQLAVNAEENTRYEEASRFRYLAMDARRLERSQGHAFWTLSWWYWLASGYGERILRAFLVLLCIWLLFAVIYSQVGFAPKESSASSSPAIARQSNESSDELSGTDALLYSLGVMALQKPDPKPATSVARTFVLIETIVGPLQAALLALAIRRKFMR